MNKGTIAIEIGHWYGEDGAVSPCGTFIEQELTIVVGNEIYRQLKRHGFTVELNGDEKDLKVLDLKGGGERRRQFR